MGGVIFQLFLGDKAAGYEGKERHRKVGLHQSSRSDFSAFPPSPTRLMTVVSCDALVGLRHMTRQRRQKLKSVKHPLRARLRRAGMSRTVLSGIGNDVILYRELLRGERGTLNIAGDELLTFLVVKGVP